METALQTYDAQQAASSLVLPIGENPLSSHFIQSIRFTRGLSLVTVTSTRRLRASAFLHKVFAAFERHQIHFDFVTISEIAVSVMVENIGKLQAIERDLEQAGKVKVEPDKAAIALSSGTGKFDTPNVSQIFQAIEKINVQVISQSDAAKSMVFVVNESEMDAVALFLFEVFFEKNTRARSSQAA